VKILVAAERLGREGGMERYLETVLPELVARGATVHVVARIIGEVPPGVTAETVRWADEHDVPDADAREAVRRAAASFRPDAAIAVNVMDAGVVEALRAAPRFTYQIHDHRPLCPNGDRVFPRTGRNCTAPLGAACVLHALTDGCAYGPRPRTLALLGRRRALRDAIARSDVVMVASRFVAERAASSGIPRARILELALPMPDDAYAETPAEPTFPPSICFAGRMVPQKGLLELVRAVAGIPPSSRPALHAFGDGPERLEAAKLAGGLDVELTTYGSVSPAGVRAGIDHSALVVIPSRWAEPFGMIGIEAFARGRPVVAYDVGGIGSWLRDGENGRAVAAGFDRTEREAALGQAIRELLSDRALWARFATRARVDAERYRTGPIVDALLATLTG
jgi:glycosyltransferase involved in cell wall biosynthesis